MWIGLIGFGWVILGYTGLYWVILNYTGLYWVILGYTGLYWVSLGLIGFDWVIPGFNEFDWVWLGLKGFWLGFKGLKWVLLGLACFLVWWKVRRRAARWHGDGEAICMRASGAGATRGTGAGSLFCRFQPPVLWLLRSIGIQTARARPPVLSRVLQTPHTGYFRLLPTRLPSFFLNCT